VFPPLAGNGVVMAADPANVMKVGLEGVPEQCKYIPMPDFAAQLNDPQIAELGNDVRSSWGNAAAGNATSAMVAKLRAGTR